MTTKTENEIYDVIDQATEIVSEEGTKCAGMSYEDGVIAALEWVIGRTDNSPVEK